MESNWNEISDRTIKAIEDGFFDEHLKAIAKAAFLRAKQINQVQQPTTSMASTTKQWWPVAPIDVTKTHERCIAVGDNSYLRSAFIGQEFVVQQGTYKDIKIVGQTAKITGAGDHSFKIEFTDKTAAPSGPGGTKEMGFISYNRVPYLFDKD